MKTAPIPEYEEARLQSVQSLNILDTELEERFDEITKRAVQELKVKISTVTIVDKDREWFKSCQGINLQEADRATSFCGHAILEDSVFVVEDTLKDERFFDNPQVIGVPFIRFYAGVKLFNRKDRMPVGVFCIKDTEPRTLSIDEVGKLLEFSQLAEDQLNKKPRLII